MDKIAKLIRDKVRHDRGKQAELAKACGVTPQAITGWIKTGKVAKKHYPTISRVLGVPLKALHGETYAINEPETEYKPISAALPYEDKDIDDLVDWWPDLPENVKNHIRMTLQEYVESLAPKLRDYMEGSSRTAQKRFNRYIEQKNRKKDKS